MRRPARLWMRPAVRDSMHNTTTRHCEDGANLYYPSTRARKRSQCIVTMTREPARGRDSTRNLKSTMQYNTIMQCRLGMLHKVEVCYW